MKRLAILFLTVILVLAFPACKSGEPAEKDNKLRVVTTIFPIYDWVREIVGGDSESVSLSVLLDNGTDLHSFQPTADDIITISQCDLFIYVGGESDAWVDKVLRQSANKNRVVIDLMDVLGQDVLAEELKEGMQGEDDEEGDSDGRLHPSDDAYDEHVWLSLKNASRFVGVISEALSKIDPEHKNVYESNASSYAGKLASLDEEYVLSVKNAAANTLLFADRFPFAYLVRDYGLDYYAAFLGCAAESEASFETVLFLANKADELNLNTILKIENSDGKIAETVKNATKEKNQTILTLDSLQSVTNVSVEKGVTYLSVMESNLAVLRQALQTAE